MKTATHAKKLAQLGHNIHTIGPIPPICSFESPRNALRNIILSARIVGASIEFHLTQLGAGGGGTGGPPWQVSNEEVIANWRDRAGRADYLRCSMSADAVRSGSANDHTRVDDLGRVSSS